VRRIGWLSLLLLALGWFVSEMPLPDLQSGETLDTPWRRTCDGWEHSTWWSQAAATRQPALHPIVVALLEMFLALAALIAFSKSPQPRSGSRRGPVAP